jgi:hypothetical protein
MIFSVEPTSRRLVAHVPQDGEVEVYDCTADACGNPVCPCRTTTVVMRPRPPSGTAREVGIDIEARGIDEIFRKRASPDNLAFAEKLLAAMDSADLALISELHSMPRTKFARRPSPSRSMRALTSKRSNSRRCFRRTMKSCRSATRSG